VEQTNALFATQERAELLDGQNANYEAQTADSNREMVSLKEENARILSELFHKKEEVGNLQAEIRDLESAQANLHAEIDSLQDTLAEKEQFYVQRDIKSNATLAQHKKLIDYLQV